MQALEVHTTAEMGVDAHVSSSSTETLTLTVWDVLLRLGISVLLCHAEIDDMDGWWVRGLRND
jgi:hypothetical protein